MDSCMYCGGNCPNESEDSQSLCDGFSGDIDHLYEDLYRDKQEFTQQFLEYLEDVDNEEANNSLNSFNAERQ